MNDSYFRKNIDAMDGYTPGEQPKVPGLIKLNTNENPYPPSPAVKRALLDLDYARLRLYPDPDADELRGAIAETFGLKLENILVGNGSDDILTIVTRAFVGEGQSVAFPSPTYSLYPVLAQLQGAASVPVPLDADFNLPGNFSEAAAVSRLIFLARPNAPTGVTYPKAQVEAVCAAAVKRKQVVFIDEAYADFADDNCVDLVNRFPNVVVSRTMSKSYSLAGLRLGWAMASAGLIAGMVKVKDSYNADLVSQTLAVAALRDQDYLAQTCATLRRCRGELAERLAGLGFKVAPSQANFLFASPPGGDGAGLFRYLKENKVLVRYFPGAATAAFARITVGTPEQIETLCRLCAAFVKG